MKIRSILAEKGGDVHTIGPDADAILAAELMKLHQIAALVVTEADTVVGLIGEREIVHAAAERRGSIVGRTVGDLMVKRPATCGPDDLATTIMERMTHKRQRHMPVVDGDRLVGVVSLGDMVKSRLGEMELESRVLRDTIRTRG